MPAKQNKLLLISLLPKSHRNLSCLSLFAALTDSGVDTKLLFLTNEREYDTDLIKEFLLTNGFRVVGISLTTPGFHFAKAITAEIKKYAPWIHVIWGGIHPTLLPEECLEHADSVCIGEGEITLARLVERIFNGGDIAGIPGIGTKTPDGRVTVNPPPPLIRDLETLPHNRYDWSRFFVQDATGLRPFDNAEYVRYSNYDGEDYTLMATRSCPHSCAFCCNSVLNALYENKGRVRRRSVDNVIAEITHATDTIDNIKFINFIDDQFLTSRKWLDEFVEKYKEEVDLPFIVRLVPGSFSEDDVKKLKHAGLRFVQIGIQSGSERTQREIFNRKFNRDKIIEASRILSRNGIFPYYDMIILNELEEEEDRAASIRLLLDLQKPYSLLLYALTPFPKTRVEEIYKQRGVTVRTDPYGENYGLNGSSDFYFQLARLIPHIPPLLGRFILGNRNGKIIRRIVDLHYQTTKDRVFERKVIKNNRFEKSSFDQLAN